MSALTYFTAIGTYLAATADSPADVDADPDLVPVFGRIRFTPLIRAGDSIQGTTLTPPTSLLLRPITVPLVGGQVSLNGTTGVRLVANTSALNLSGALFYQVDFFDLQAVSDSLDLRSFSFTAPTVDTTVDLVTVAPVTGTLAGGTTVGPQGPTGPTGPAGAGAADASASVKGVVQLAGDLAGTAAAPTVPGKVATSRTVNGHALTADVTVTKSDVGLALADNVADAAKPVSAAQAAADAATLASANSAATSADTTVLTTATGRAVGFAVAMAVALG